MKNAYYVNRESEKTRNQKAEYASEIRAEIILHPRPIREGTFCYAYSYEIICILSNNDHWFHHYTSTIKSDGCGTMMYFNIRSRNTFESYLFYDSSYFPYINPLGTQPREAHSIFVDCSFPGRLLPVFRRSF